MAGNLKDFATGIVVTAPSPATSGTTLTLQTGEGARMPAVPFYATAHPVTEMPTLDNAEKILVTNVTGDVLTITRAQGDTTAKSIDVTWRVSNALFSHDLEATVGAGNGITEYLTDTDSPDVTDAKYLYLSRTPITTVETSYSATVTSGTSPVEIKSFIMSSTGIGVTAIPAGVWQFNIWANNSAGSTAGFDIVVYAATVAGGVVTLGTPLFTTANQTLTSTKIGYNIDVVQPAFTGLTAAHRLVLLFRATQSIATSRNVTIYLGGDTHASHVHTPMQTRHNDLAGLNLADYQHLTAAQLAALHPQVTGGTPALTLGATNIAGNASTFIRTNDTILAFDATALTAEAIASTSSVGTAATAARRDHRHPMPTALAMLSGVGGGWAACATAIGTAAKTLTLTGYSLVVGGTVGVTFTNGNSAATPTMNINAAGAKPIFANGVAATTIPAGFKALLMYDGTNYNVINEGLGTTVATTQAFGDTAVAGVAVEGAHVDHKHAMPASPKDTTAVTGILSGNGTTISAASNNTALAAVSGSNTGDQTATTVANTPAGRIAATTVQAAINELDGEKAYMTIATSAPSTPSAGDLWFDTDDETGITSGNADTVDNLHASATPTANKLLALDSNAKIPASIINGSPNLISETTLGSNVTSFTISGLDIVTHGNVYQLIISGAASAGSDPTIALNGDVSSNYISMVYGLSTTPTMLSAYSANVLPSFRIDTIFFVDYTIIRKPTGEISILGHWVDATGYDRTVAITSTTQRTNITSITFNTNSAVTFSSGTNIKIYKK